jgi:hypothetical protein
MSEPNVIAKIVATGSGVCHDKDGNQLDQHGNIAVRAEDLKTNAPQQEQEK